MPLEVRNFNKFSKQLKGSLLHVLAFAVSDGTGVKLEVSGVD